MGLASRNLTRDRTRLGLSVAGVALATMLVLLLSGFRDGMNRQIMSYLDHSPGSIVVAQSGIKNMLVATSVLPPGTRDRVLSTDGVTTAAPVLSSFVILELRSEKRSAYLVGFDPALGGGPWRLADGRDVASDYEAVVDRALARRYELAVGDGFDLMGRRFTIVGLSEGTTSWMTSFIFIRKSAAESLFSAPGMTSFLLVAPSAGMTDERTARAIARQVGVNSVRAEVLPGDKAMEIRKLQLEGKRVGMVGDGTNDAPALTQADVGFAIGSGTDVAIEAADVTLVGGSLKGVVLAIEVSRATMRNVFENLFGAFVYNTLGLPVALGVLYPFFGILLSPILAAAAMSFSSVTVISNANRLRHFRTKEVLA